MNDPQKPDEMSYQAEYRKRVLEPAKRRFVFSIRYILPAAAGVIVFATPMRDALQPGPTGDLEKDTYIVVGVSGTIGVVIWTAIRLVWRRFKPKRPNFANHPAYRPRGRKPPTE